MKKAPITINGEVLLNIIHTVLLLLPPALMLIVLRLIYVQRTPPFIMVSLLLSAFLFAVAGVIVTLGRKYPSPREQRRTP